MKYDLWAYEVNDMFRRNGYVLAANRWDAERYVRKNHLNCVQGKSIRVFLKKIPTHLKGILNPFPFPERPDNDYDAYRF